MNIREVCRFRSPRVYGDNPRVGFHRAPLPNHLEKHGMIRRHIRADNQEHIGVLDILVARRRAIRTERLDITYHCRRHAEPAVCVNIIGAEEPLEQFVENIGGFGV